MSAINDQVLKVLRGRSAEDIISRYRRIRPPLAVTRVEATASENFTAGTILFMTFGSMSFSTGDDPLIWTASAPTLLTAATDGIYVAHGFMSIITNPAGGGYREGWIEHLGKRRDDNMINGYNIGGIEYSRRSVAPPPLLMKRGEPVRLAGFTNVANGASDYDPANGIVVALSLTRIGFV